MSASSERMSMVRVISFDAALVFPYSTSTGPLLNPGQLVGELGFLTPEHVRTQTVECVDDVEMMVITYDKVSELYFQNPTFGFYFLKLSSERLLQNVHRLEQELAARSQPRPA